MRDVRDKKRKKLIRAYTEMVCQRIMLSWSLIIDINVKNIKNDKILWEKHSLILGNVKDNLYFPEKGCHLGTNRSDNET